MSKNILETKYKKITEKTIEKLFGKNVLNKIKKSGKRYLDYRNTKLKRSSKEDINRLKALAPKYLHYGCGARVMKGWANIDIGKTRDVMRDIDKKFSTYFFEENQGTSNDYFRIDFTEVGIPLENNSVSGIFHEDFIEHLFQRDTFVFLAETLRVLKPGGVHRISTPNLSMSMKLHSDFPKGKEGVYTNEWNKHLHYNIFTPSYLEEVAKLIGYSKVIFTARNESSLNPLPKGYRPGDDKQSDTEQIFCDLIK